jgi:hypothetical protein
MSPHSCRSLTEPTQQTPATALVALSLSTPPAMVGMYEFFEDDEEGEGGDEDDEEESEGCDEEGEEEIPPLSASLSLALSHSNTSSSSSPFSGEEIVVSPSSSDEIISLTDSVPGSSPRYQSTHDDWEMVLMGEGGSESEEGESEEKEEEEDPTSLDMGGE